MAELQVLIAAYGPDALEKIASLPHASHEGVEYVVSWQDYDRNRVPDRLRQREDFRIQYEESRGLCNNRNALLRLASADYAVIADDDLVYTPRHLENILEGFETFPDFDILTFRYESPDYPKTYPDHIFNLQKPPRGYFVTSMEIALNLKQIRRHSDWTDALSFNPAFGVNGLHFGSGEEDLFITRLLRKGYNAMFIPRDICMNTQSTTAERTGTTKEFIATKGAVMTYVKPGSWRLRMLAHALRASHGPKGNRIGFFRYCSWWLSGVREAHKNKVFENYR